MNAADPDAEMMEAAMNWFVLLASGVASVEERAAFARWRLSHAGHERAWREIDDIGRIVRAGGGCMPAAVRTTLLSADGRLQRRRRALKTLLMAGVTAGPAAWLARERAPLRDVLADYRTGIGVRRALVLADGTRLWLNTATAVDVNFTVAERWVNLLGGEIEIVTAADPAARPFRVNTREGVLSPIGTRFVVRRLDDEGDTRLYVGAGAVEVRARDADVPAVLVSAGQKLRFSAGAIYGPDSSGEAPGAWVDGMLSAERMRLGDFVRELSRYRPGLLRCDPAIAGLRLTGTYPLRDTDLILGKLAQTLPVRVIYRTPYWVTVAALDA
jgi:transmembrane sensor